MQIVETGGNERNDQDRENRRPEGFSSDCVVCGVLDVGLLVHDLSRLFEDSENIMHLKYVLSINDSTHRNG